MNKKTPEKIYSVVPAKERLWEFYLLGPKDTGIPKGYIWVTSKIGRKKARVKYIYSPLKSYKDPGLNVSISQKPQALVNKINAKDKEIQQVKEFVNLNYVMLKNLWNTGTCAPYDSTREWIEKLKKVEG